MNKIIKQVKTILGICIIGMLVINNIVFIHAHKLPNGYIIIHAHPFNKSKDAVPFKIHYHSNVEFLLLHNLQLLFFVGIFILGAKFLYKSEFLYTCCSPVFFNPAIHHFSRRGPPVTGIVIL